MQADAQAGRQLSRRCTFNFARRNALLERRVRRHQHSSVVAERDRRAEVGVVRLHCGGERDGDSVLVLCLSYRADPTNELQRSVHALLNGLIA